MSITIILQIYSATVVTEKASPHVHAEHVPTI